MRFTVTQLCLCWLFLLVVLFLVVEYTIDTDRLSKDITEAFFRGIFNEIFKPVQLGDRFRLHACPVIQCKMLSFKDNLMECDSDMHDLFPRSVFFFNHTLRPQQNNYIKWLIRFKNDIRGGGITGLNIMYVQPGWAYGYNPALAWCVYDTLFGTIL